MFRAPDGYGRDVVCRTHTYTVSNQIEHIMQRNDNFMRAHMQNALHSIVTQCGRARDDALELFTNRVRVFW